MNGVLKRTLRMASLCSCSFINLSLLTPRRRNMSGIRNQLLLNWLGTRISIWHRQMPKMMWTRLTWNFMPTGKPSLVITASLDLLPL
ncbi:hypothetical protein RHMOL_Rhmol02G0308200 [Rhododendron molle]|uniref:Uncharacterized protein n=1 Tax=Rhododendron molle TaxID=49168 RepID=A0ACC0PZ83_RHOML|nr:hypothetical protein RHMOL_Rhmol02G0308200 [Rhododendron molle]